MFRKPTIADIFVKEVRTKLDQSLVPVFPPDKAGVGIGTIARFVDGAFDRRGHLIDILGGQAEYEAHVALASPNAPTQWTFASDGKVSIGSSATVNVAGKDRISARVLFEGDRAVVACYHEVVEQAVLAPRDFDDLLWNLYTSGRLAPDEVVVSTERRAASGTVLVNRKSGIDVNVSVDPSFVVGEISFANLAVGAEFGAGKQASWQVAGPDLLVGVQVKGLNARADAVDDKHGWQALAGQSVENFLGSEFPIVTAEDILADADFSADEDGE